MGLKHERKSDLISEPGYGRIRKNGRNLAGSGPGPDTLSRAILQYTLWSI